MNYSDYDSDGYSSNEDADYVPSDDNLSEDDINECEKEGPLHEDDTVPHPSKVSHRKRKTKDISERKRKQRVVKSRGGGEGAEKSQEVESHAEGEDVKQQKNSDDLWASFLSDVGSRPKDSTVTTVPKSGTTQEADASALKNAPHTAQETKASEPLTVTITKVFDFAGEEVRVKKEVPVDSREAKSYLKTQPTMPENDTEEVSNIPPSQPSPSAPSAKRAAGLSGILGQIGGKKQKMSTLEKSKMDWDAFKSEEGITEELAIHNRGREGYVERKNFLERVDHRQFELEKAVRLSKLKQ